MLTHGRLGAEARGRVLHSELVRAVLEAAFPLLGRLGARARVRDAWALRGVFDAMAQTDYFGSSDEDEEDEDGEDEEDEDGEDEEDEDGEDEV